MNVINKLNNESLLFGLYFVNSIHILTGFGGNSKFVVPEIPSTTRGEAESNSWYAKGQRTCYYSLSQSLGVLLY